MSTSEGEAQLPAFNALRTTHKPPRLSPKARCLFCCLHGSLDFAVYFMASKGNASSLEPYLQNQTWHPFSQTPLTHPKVANITVSANDLNDWEDMWLETHRGHTPAIDPDFLDEDPYTCWGGLPDYNPASDEYGPTRLLSCGTRRPRGKAFKVVVRLAAGPFVTMHK